MGFARDLARKSGFGKEIKPVAILLGVTIVGMWCLELVDWLVMSGSLDQWGIAPRSTWGLVGIPLSPFLHGSFSHLAANTVPLFVMGLIIGVRGMRTLLEATAIIALVGGASVWLIGKGNSSHIGASGVIFGYFGYLIARGFFDKSVRSLLVGVVVLMIYGGLFWGVLPQGPGISWEGHLFGLLAGVLAAKLQSNHTLSTSVE